MTLDIKKLTKDDLEMVRRFDGKGHVMDIHCDIYRYENEVLSFTIYFVYYNRYEYKKLCILTAFYS